MYPGVEINKKEEFNYADEENKNAKNIAPMN